MRKILGPLILVFILIFSNTLYADSFPRIDFGDLNPFAEELNPYQSVDANSHLNLFLGDFVFDLPFPDSLDDSFGGRILKMGLLLEALQFQLIVFHELGHIIAAENSGNGWDLNLSLGFPTINGSVGVHDPYNYTWENTVGGINQSMYNSYVAWQYSLFSEDENLYFLGAASLLDPFFYNLKSRFRIGAGNDLYKYHTFHYNLSREISFDDFLNKHLALVLINPFIYHTAFIWGSYAFHGETPDLGEIGILPPFIGSYLLKDKIFVNASIPILFKDRVFEISLGFLENPARLARVGAKIYNLSLGDARVLVGGAIGPNQYHFSIGLKTPSLLIELEYQKNDILARYLRKVENGFRLQIRYIF